LIRFTFARMRIEQLQPMKPTPIQSPANRRIRLGALGAEPFRLFFPAGALAGIIGVLLWPLHLWGLAGPYPGPQHAQIMALGFFGAFIFGFLGTALPRLLSAPPLALWQTGGLLGLHLAMVASLATGRVIQGDVLFLLLLAGFVACLVPRLHRRQDIPPPGFVLVGIAFLCAAAGAILRIMAARGEPDPAWVTLQRLLSYQGFVLLPILGIGPFLLPRFFGMPSSHDFPESTRIPPPAWTRKAWFALGIAALILMSFFVEAAGEFRLAHGLRFATTLGYLWRELPLFGAPTRNRTLGFCLQLALVGVLAGFLAVALVPRYRVSLLHLTLVGGFAVLTVVVATRVAFGHSGSLNALQQPNRWLLVAVGLMLFGMATRISGDFWPKILASHYSYGAILWTAGIAVWAWRVLPKMWIADE
jgi:uncharacterized protein involved in response to NO